MLLRAEVTRNEHGAARIRAERHRHQDIDDGIGSADGGEGGLSCEFACDDGIGKRIKLLKERAAQKGQDVKEQYLLGFSHGEIAIHGRISFEGGAAP